jgi:AmiR/NasT family two-component response regulator
MDIVLAGLMRGTDVARQIWTRWRIPVVYLTGFSDSVVLEDIKGTEAFGFILKPFEPKLVHAVVQLALSRRAELMTDTSDS